MCAIDNLEMLYIIFITLIYFGVVVVLKIWSKLRIRPRCLTLCGRLANIARQTK